MTLQQMKYMVAVANCHSFSQASRECFVAQTAISKQIANLENELNCKLFVRGQHSVELTRQGEIFLNYASEVLHMCDNAVQDIHMSQIMEKKKIRIGYRGHIERRLLTDIAVNYTEHHPDIFMTYQYVGLERILPSLLSHEQDVIFAPYEHVKGVPHISSYHLLDCPIHLAVSLSNPAAKLDMITRDALKNMNFISLDVTASPGLCSKAERQWAQLGFRPNITYHASEMESALLMAESNSGVMLLPKLLNAFEPRKLKYVPIEGFESFESLCVAWLSSNTEVETNRFIQFVKKWFKQYDPSDT